MKKQGFTLPELLITLAIIGVAAALLSPVFSNIIPDKNKVMILKKFNAIQNINNEILNNKEMYYSKAVAFDQNLTIESCAGLGCTDQPLRGVYNDPNYSGEHKYVLILADMLGVKKDDVVKTGGSLTVPSETIQYDSEFKTVDGTIYRFRYPENNENVHLAPTWMYVTLKGSKAKQDKGFFSEDNKNPLMYKFLIKTNGEVVPADPLSVAYSRNPLSNNSRKEDRELAKQLANNQKINNPDEDNPNFLEAWDPNSLPGGETPGGETPGGETPGGETPGGETPGGETPGGETPGGETPGGETPGGETPGGETPGGETPGGETPGGETPTDPTDPSDPTGGGGEPSTPTDEPSDPEPSDPVDPDPEPSDPEPSDPVDPDPEPSEPTPSDPILPDIDLPLKKVDCSALILNDEDREACKIKLGDKLLPDQDTDGRPDGPTSEPETSSSGADDTQYEYIVCNPTLERQHSLNEQALIMQAGKKDVVTIYIRSDGSQGSSCANSTLQSVIY